MQPDPTWEETSEWLRKAASDLHAARTLIQADPTLSDIALYHCQQAAEKAIKGFLVFRGQIFRKTHNIAEIGQQAVVLDRSLESVIKRAAVLTDYVWKYRYPGVPSHATPEETQTGIALAQAVMTAIADRLPMPFDQTDQTP
jgi:HEPN domain-containing protein